MIAIRVVTTSNGFSKIESNTYSNNHIPLIVSYFTYNSAYLVIWPAQFNRWMHTTAAASIETEVFCLTKLGASQVWRADVAITKGA